MRIDLHTHSNLSDGTDSPTRLMLAAAAAGLDIVALTDHDTMAGVAEARAAGQRVGVRVLAGVELSTNHAGGEIHLLGYGMDPRNSELNAEMLRLRRSRTERLPRMLARLTELGMTIGESAVLGRAGGSGASVGRPHVADELVAAGYAANRAEAFAKYLDRGRPAYVERYTLPLTDAIALVHAAGGAAVLAHPGIRGAEHVLGGADIERLAAEHGLDGIEVDYPLHDAATRDLFHRLGQRCDLVRTGSSDYHGGGKQDHELGCETTRESAYRELLRRIERYRVGLGA